MDSKVATTSTHNHFRRVHFLVSGDVQGVGFRAFTLERANGLSLVGWVRNNWDGKVEGEAEGPPASIAEFLALIERGPISAHVDSIGIRDIAATGIDFLFRVTR